MLGSGRAEVVAGWNGRADDGFPHEDGVEDEAAEEGTEGEEDGGGVGGEGVAAGHGARDEWSEDAHEQSGDNADDHTAARDVACRTQGSVGFAYEYDRDDGHEDACSEQEGIAARLNGVAEDNAFDQRDADGDGKGDGEADDLDACNEEYVGDIEDEAADRGVEEVDVVGGVDVCEEGSWAAGVAAHGEGEQQGDEEDAEPVVPVVKLETIVARAFEGVGKGAPADGAEDGHEQGGGEGGWDKHTMVLQR